MNETMEQQTVVIKPGRDVVASMAKGFREELKSAISEGANELTIDLDGVEMVDSVGLGVFIATHNSLNSAGGKLTICNVSDDINKLFKTMRLDKHFTVKGV